jgi:release factor glutamine methyltransferase
VTTIRTALADAVRALDRTSPTPRVDAEILLRLATDVSRSDIAAFRDRPLTAAQQTTFADLISRRQRGEPIAYLLGKREFWTLDLEVSPATLIPRPETELVVERALVHIAKNAAAEVLDLGTGSGAIALAIAAERPKAHVTAIDRSAAALDVARHNAVRHRIANVSFALSDWFDGLSSKRFSVVVSNPPYVRRDDPHLVSGDLRFEPIEALVGGDDGLDAIRRIVAQASDRLNPNGWLILEHGYDQADAVRALLSTAGYTAVNTFRDLASHERVTEGRQA